MKNRNYCGLIQIFSLFLIGFLLISTFLICKDDNSKNYESSGIELTLGELSLLSELLTRKMHIAQELAKYGKGNISSFDPLKIDSLCLISNDENNTINYLLENIQIHRISNFQVKDISINPYTRSLSVLLKFEKINVNGTILNNQKIITNSNASSVKSTATYNNKNTNNSIFNISFNEWTTSWFGNLVNADITKETIEVKHLLVKSYFDKSSSNFTCNVTFTNCYSNGFQKLSSLILNKISEEIDLAIEKMLSYVIKQDKIKTNSKSFINDLNNMLMIHATRTKRQVPCETGEDLDEYVDSLLKFSARVIRSMEPIDLPNATIDLPEYNLQLFLHKGAITKGYTISRKQPAWIYCTNDSVSLGLTVGFESLRLKYKYRALLGWHLLFDGELEADVQHSKAQVQFTQTIPDEDSDENPQQRVDRLRIWRLGRIRVILTGLGNFTKTLSMLLTLLLNRDQDQLNPTLRRVEEEALSIINEQLKNINVPFFSVV